MNNHSNEEKLSKEGKSTAIKRKKIPSLYNKKQFLEILKEINCNPNKERVLTSRFRTLNAEEAKGDFKIIYLNFLFISIQNLHINFHRLYKYSGKPQSAAIRLFAISEEQSEIYEFK